MGGSHSRDDEAARWAHEEAERKARENWERENREREEATRRAREEAERMAYEARRQAEEEEARTRHMQAEAQRLAAEAERAANEAREAVEAAEREAREEDARRALEEEARSAREEAMRKAQEEAAKRALEDAHRLRVAQEDAYKAEVARIEAENRANAAKMEAEAAEAEIQRIKTMQAEAKRAADEAKRVAEEATAAKEKAEDDLKDGIQPVEWPTPLEVTGAQRTLQYKEGLFHCAIAGLSGTGKSSLINAFCGVSNKDPRAAKTGIVETTATVSRYPDTKPQSPFVWYDVPGAGTLDIPDWRYFNEQGLYVFDCIIVLFDNRFTATDVAVLRNCKRFNIPSFIVRSKSNQHIQNIMRDLGYSGNDEDDEEDQHENPDPTELFTMARDTFIEATRQSVEANLEKAELAPQRVYMVCKEAMLTVVKGNIPKTTDIIDEVELLNDLNTRSLGKYAA